MTFALRQASVGFKKILPSVVFLTLLSFFALPLSHSEATSFTTGLVGHWKLDETSGTTAADSSGSGNNGTLTNGPTISTNYAPTIFSNTRAVDFDGTDDYVAVPDHSSLDLTNKVTLSFWFNRAASGDIFHWGKQEAAGQASYLLQIFNDNKIYWVFSSDGTSQGYIVSNSAYTITGWHHLSGTYDGVTQTATIYLDGVVVPSTTVGTIPTSLFNSTSAFGNRYQGSGMNYSKGLSDDVRLYNRTLSPEEISVLAAEKSLVGYWKLDGNTNDSSGNGKNGTVVGGATPSATVPTLNFIDSNSYTFDGDGDYISAGDVLDLGTNDMTISAWVKTSAALGIVVAKTLAGPGAYRFGVGVVGNKSYAFMAGDSGDVEVSTSTSVTDNQWHHLTWVFDRSADVSLYIDGEFENSSAISQWDGLDFQSSHELLIGINDLALVGPFSGQIDDVRLYHRTLSSTEISALAAGNHLPATWTGEHSIYYEDPNNWNTGAVPDPYSNVTIANAGARPVLTDAVSISNLTINAGASLDLKDKNLTQLDAGVFSNNGTLILDGTQTLTNFTNDTNSGQEIIRNQSNFTSLPTGSSYYNLRIEDPTENGLVGYWKLDEGSGSTTLDLSGNGNNGTLVNAPTWSTSTGATNFYNPRSLSFDGTNDYVAINSEIIGDNDSFTLAAWFIPNELNRTQGIVTRGKDGYGNGWSARIGLTSDNKYQVYVVTTSGGATAYAATGTSNAAIGVPAHIVGTWEPGTGLKVFVNGVLEGVNPTLTTSLRNSTAGFRIADNANDSFPERAHGIIDDVRIYNRALSAEEAASLARGNYANGTTSVATYTPSSVPTINGSLSLDSGNMTLGSNSLSVTGTLGLNGATLTHGAGTITTANYTQKGGVFTGGAGNMTINGTYTQTGGTFTAPSGTMTLASTIPDSTVVFRATAGTFAHNNGTVTFSTNHTCQSPLVTFSIDVNTSLTLHNAVVNVAHCDALENQYSAFQVAAGDTLIVEGNLSYLNGNIISGGDIDLRGNLSIGSGADGSEGNSGDMGGTITFTGSADQTYSHASGGAAPHIRINKPSGTVTPAEGTTSLALIALTLTQGSFTAPTGTMEFRGTITNTSAFFTQENGTTFNHNNGTVDFHTDHTCQNPLVTFSIDVPTSLTLYNVVARAAHCGNPSDSNSSALAPATGDTIIVTGSFNLSDGFLEGSWELQGNVTIGSSSNGGAAALTLTGTNDQAIDKKSGTAPSGTLLINKPSGTVTLSGSLVLNTSGQDLTLSGGTLNLNGYNLTVNDSFGVNSGATLQLKGGETVSTPTLNAGSVVKYDGDSVPVTVKDWDYKTLNLSAPGKEFQFTAGGSYVVATEWIAEGTEDNLVTLRSTSDGMQWEIDPQGTRTLAYLDVQDSKNINATAIFASEENNVNSGNNVAWLFDVTPPNAPNAPELVPASDTGSSDSDRVTADSTPTFSVIMCEDGEVTLSGASLTATETCNGGAVDIQMPTVADGTYVFKAFQEDEAGNVSEQSEGVTVTIDTTDPVIAEVTPVTTPATDTTPNYAFSSTESGSVAYAGDCTSSTSTVTSGITIITFAALAVGTHSNCAITLSDAAGNESNALAVTAFTIEAPAAASSSSSSSDEESSVATGGGGGGGGGGRGAVGPGGRSNKAQIVRETFLRRFERQVASDEEVIPPIAGSSASRSSARSSRPTVVEGESSSAGFAVAEKRGHLEISEDGVAVLYKDVPMDAWFTPYISFLIEEDIAEGYKDETGKVKGEFGVENPVTYAELAKMVLQASHEDLKTAAAPRNMTARGTWASPFIALAEDLHFSVFVPTLDIMKPATRGEVIQTILEAFDIPANAKNFATFTDLPSTHPHAPAIGVAYLYGLIDGDTDATGKPTGTVRPDDKVNRAEVAKIVALALKLLK